MFVTSSLLKKKTETKGEEMGTYGSDGSDDAEEGEGAAMASMTRGLTLILTMISFCMHVNGIHM